MVKEIIKSIRMQLSHMRYRLSSLLAICHDTINDNDILVRDTCLSSCLGAPKDK